MRGTMAVLVDVERERNDIAMGAKQRDRGALLRWRRLKPTLLKDAGDIFTSALPAGPVLLKGVKGLTSKEVSYMRLT
jgi:hypothetical protein